MYFVAAILCNAFSDTSVDSTVAKFFQRINRVQYFEYKKLQLPDKVRGTTKHRKKKDIICQNMDLSELALCPELGIKVLRE